jgi:3-hydroxybutyryl-CoA dehydrogenase
MKKIAVLGAGVMGTGIAQTFAEHGLNVILLDLTEEILKEAKEKIKNNIRFQHLIHKNKEQMNPENVLKFILFTTDYQKLEDVDFVIENVPEKWEVKKEVYEKIDKICKENCIYMVNTSCISITKIAALTNRPSKVVGTHFMNPVPIKAAVETIKGYHTSEETLKELEELLKSVGKESIVVNDYPGFVSNRVSHLFMNEAAFLVQDQVAEPEKVDEIFKKCFGHIMGPLETADLIGLDTVMDSLDVLYESYQDPKFRCCPLIRKLVYAGRCGRKVGKGFYNY